MSEQLDAVGVTGKSAAAWALVLYSALGPGALATYLQTKGQASVSAAQAQVARKLYCIQNLRLPTKSNRLQVIFSLAPLFTVLFSQLTLGGESLGPLAWVGGATVIAASFISREERKT